MDYNERKLIILETVDDLGEATSLEVWENQEDAVSLRAIQMALLRCHRQGLLNRSSGVYTLTEKGFERIKGYREKHNKKVSKRKVLRESLFNPSNFPL